MDFGPFGPVIAAGIVTIAGSAATYFVGRRMGKLGVGPASMQLYDTLAKTVDTQAKEITSLRRQLDDAQADILNEARERRDMATEFLQCKTRLKRLEALIADRFLETP